MVNASFRKCSACSAAWTTREDFLSDPGVKLVGYQVQYDAPDEGCFLFNHSCGTTMGLRAGDFRDLHDGPMLEGRPMGTPECPGNCLREGDLEPCPAKCECAYVRDVLQVVGSWPKAKAGP